MGEGIILVLTRDSGETLQIITEDSEVIELIIVKIDGQQVKIGFHAPPACRVLRKDIIETIAI